MKQTCSNLKCFHDVMIQVTLRVQPLLSKESEDESDLENLMILANKGKIDPFNHPLIAGMIYYKWTQMRWAYRLIALFQVVWHVAVIWHVLVDMCGILDQVYTKAGFFSVHLV